MVFFNLETNYVSSLWAAVAVHDIKANFFTLVKGFETGALDSGEVYKHVVAVFALNKSETFFLR